MNNLNQPRKILITEKLYLDGELDLKKVKHYLNKSYPEVTLIKIDGDFMLCERRDGR